MCQMGRCEKDAFLTLRHAIKWLLQIGCLYTHTCYLGQNQHSKTYNFVLFICTTTTIEYIFTIVVLTIQNSYGVSIIRGGTT